MAFAFASCLDALEAREELANEMEELKTELQERHVGEEGCLGC